ncbi:hypothetical protein PspLS_01909 [Pyricularia sp. CBS 133598]|nr:hypothetical protein PspLS_01909 [Pyricularia sp. CBS 133598]
MFSKFAALTIIGSAIANPVPGFLQGPGIRACYETETPAQLCYTAPENTPQEVEVEDVKFIAAYLRAYGAQTRAGRLFSMAAADAPDCGEWLLYSHGTAQAFAKHIDNTVDSTVLFADIANTIDGGANANQTQQEGALLNCGTDGGSQGVMVNAAHPTYSGSTYPKGHVTSGIIIKIVAS